MVVIQTTSCIIVALYILHEKLCVIDHMVLALSVWLLYVCHVFTLSSACTFKVLSSFMWYLTTGRFYTPLDTIRRYRAVTSTD